MNRSLWYNNSRFGSVCRQAGAPAGFTALFRPDSRMIPREVKYGPDERMLALAEKIAAAEGLFVWKGE